MERAIKAQIFVLVHRKHLGLKVLFLYFHSVTDVNKKEYLQVMCRKLYPLFVPDFYFLQVMIPRALEQAL